MKIDYIKSNFKTEILTKILGRLNHPLLKKIKNKLITNVARVTCNLGGSANGHLGLIINAVEYATVSLIQH